MNDSLADFIRLIYVAFAVGGVTLVGAGVFAGVATLRRGTAGRRALAIVLAVGLGLGGGFAAIILSGMLDEDEPAWVFAYWGVGACAMLSTAVFDVLAAVRRATAAP